MIDAIVQYTQTINELQRASTLHKVLVDDPGVFCGDREDFERWYNAMDKHLGLYDDSFLISRLAGTALHMIKHPFDHSGHENGFDSTNEVLEYLRAVFAKDRDRRALEQQYEQWLGHSGRQVWEVFEYFYCQWVFYAEALDIPQADRLSEFRMILGADYNAIVEDMEFDSLEGLVDACRRVDEHDDGPEGYWERIRACIDSNEPCQCPDIGW
jgi:hypothetical protein